MSAVSGSGAAVEVRRNGDLVLQAYAYAGTGLRNTILVPLAPDTARKLSRELADAARLSEERREDIASGGTGIPTQRYVSDMDDVIV